MIYFLSGPDTYRSREKLSAIIGAFRTKSGGIFNIIHVDAEDQPGVVFTLGRTASLFSEKELIILERVSAAPDDVKRYLRGELKRWQSDRHRTVIFFEAEGEDSAISLLEEIKRSAVKSQVFRSLPTGALGRWIENQAARREVQLTPREKTALIERCGSNLWALSHELEKIRSGWSLGEMAGREEKVWNFTDAFFRGPGRAFLPLMQLVRIGYEPIYLLAALAGSLRTLALIGWGMGSGKLKRAAAELHPYVLKKNRALAEGMDAAQLKRYYALLATTDVELKTGKLPPPLPLMKLVLRKDPATTPAA